MANTKVLLKVKSGPGELVGEVERDLVGDQIIFTGLQFTEPGNYVIEAIPSNNEYSTIEYEISVDKQPEVIPQDNREDTDETEEISGERPVIAQIDPPKIKLDPLEYNAEVDTNSIGEMVQSIGYAPFLYYYGDQIPETDIKSLNLYYDGMIPVISVTFLDTKDYVRSNPPLNDTKFEVFLTSGSKYLKSIHLKFKIKSHKELKSGKYLFKGTLDIDQLYQVNYRSYTGSSFNIFRDISKELKLGFNSNISDTNDTMTWKNTGQVYQQFIYDVVRHSYISDNSFLLAYIDFYWCLNYVDVEKEWRRDISTDLGIISRSVTDVDNGGGKQIDRLLLTNDPAVNKSNNFIRSYKFINKSTDKSLKEGHFTRIKYYDNNKKQLLEFDVDSLSSDNENVMPLKGSPTDGEKYKDFFITKFLGTYDLDNVHNDYKYAEIQNRRNLDNLTKVVAEFTLPNPNFNIYKYQKVSVQIYNSTITVTNDTYIDERISGEWMVIDIRYKWSKGSLKQILTLSRKELNKKHKEKDVPVIEETNNEDNSQINDNPNDSTESPNSVYNVGDSYTIQGEDGSFYKITVEQVSDNGKDIVAKIKEI